MPFSPDRVRNCRLLSDTGLVGVAASEIGLFVSKDENFFGIGVTFFLFRQVTKTLSHLYADELGRVESWLSDGVDMAFLGVMAFTVVNSLAGAQNLDPVVQGVFLGVAVAVSGLVEIRSRNKSDVF